MSSNYLLNLKINQLQQEVLGIGDAIGYFWNLSSPNGLTIDGSDTAVSISAPNTNNTMRGFSDVERSGNWEITCVPVDNSNMFVGVSTNISNVFSPTSSPSMNNCNFGVLIDTDNGLRDLYLIVNGVISLSTNFTFGDIIKIDYNNTDIKFYAGGTLISGFTQNIPSLPAVKLVCGSYYGGQLNTIRYTGALTSGGGGGGSQNLASVLATGNNGSNLDITNVGNVELNEYLRIGNAVGNTSQIHMCWETGNTLTGSNIQLVALNDGTGYSELQIQNYLNNVLDATWLRMNSSLTIFDTEVNAPTFTVPSGNVIDTVNNPPVYFATGSNAGWTSKVITSNTPTSILRFDLTQINYNLYTMNIQPGAFIFTVNTPSPLTSASITAFFWISNVQDDPQASPYPLSTSYIVSQNINPNGGSGGATNSQPLVLSRLNTNKSRYLYLNVRLVSSATFTTNIVGNTFDYSLLAQPAGVATVNPTVVV